MFGETPPVARPSPEGWGVGGSERINLFKKKRARSFLT